jgi:hypothetical protein
MMIMFLSFPGTERGTIRLFLILGFCLPSPFMRFKSIVIKNFDGIA